MTLPVSHSLKNIEIFHALSPDPARVLQKDIVEPFNKKNSKNQIEINTGFQKYEDAFKAALANPTNDVILAVVPEFYKNQVGPDVEAAKKAIIPISDILTEKQYSSLIKKTSELVIKSFNPPNETTLHTVPLASSCGVGFYNETYFNNIGVDLNTPLRRIEDFEKILQKIRQHGDNDVNVYTSAWTAAYLVEVVLAFNNEAMALPDNGRHDGTGEYQLSKSTLLIKHLLDLRRQIREGVYKHAGQDNALARKLFLDQQVLVLFQGAVHYESLQKDASFQVGCFPLPKLVTGQEKENYAFPLGGSSIYVIGKDITPEMKTQIRKFLIHLTSEKVQRIWHEKTAYLPLLKDLPEKLEKEGFYLKHPLHKAVVQQTIQALTGPYSYGIHTKNYAEARKAIFALLDTILSLPEDKEELVEKKIREILVGFDNTYSIRPPKADVLPPPENVPLQISIQKETETKVDETSIISNQP